MTTDSALTRIEVAGLVYLWRDGTWHRQLLYPVDHDIEVLLNELARRL